MEGGGWVEVHVSKERGGYHEGGTKKRKDADTPFRTLCLGILRD